MTKTCKCNRTLYTFNKINGDLVGCACGRSWRVRFFNGTTVLILIVPILGDLAGEEI